MWEGLAHKHKMGSVAHIAQTMVGETNALDLARMGLDNTSHGSYLFNWTTWDEVAWKNFYRVWMSFLNDYKNKGGRVTVSDDASFIYNLWGFGYIEEMELLQEQVFIHWR